DLKFNEAILYRMTEEYKRQYGVVKQIQTVKEDDASKDSERRKAYRKEIDDAEKHHQTILDKEGLFREDLSELTRQQLERMSQLHEAYQSKLDTDNKKYGQNLKTVSNAADAELKRRAKAEESYIISIIRQKQDEAEAERTTYNERLEKAGNLGLERAQMTARQPQAVEILEKQHRENVNKIDAHAIAKEIDARLGAHRDVNADIRIAIQEQLAQMTTLVQATEELSAVMSEMELAQMI